MSPATFQRKACVVVHARVAWDDRVVRFGIPLGAWPQWSEGASARHMSFTPIGVDGSLVEAYPVMTQDEWHEAAVSRVQSRHAVLCAGDASTADGADAQAAGRAAPGARPYIGDNAVTPPRSAVQADLFGEVV